MNTLLRTLALVAILTAFALPAHAALTSESSSFGPDTVTRDSVSGLDWLDITESQNYSYNQMVIEMVPSGIFEDWTYATPAQLDALVIAAGFNLGDPIATRAAGLENLMNLVGLSYTVGNPGDSFYRRAVNGMFNIPFSLGRQIGGYHIDMNGAAFTSANGSSLWGSTTDTNASDIGHWLVRSAPVAAEKTTWGGIKRLND